MFRERKELPEEFIEFAKRNSDKNSYDDLRIILFQKYKIEMCNSLLSTKLRSAGFVQKYTQSGSASLVGEGLYRRNKKKEK